MSVLGHIPPVSWLALGGLILFGIYSLATRGQDDKDGARFARSRDLKPLREATGIPLGRHQGRDLRAEVNASVLLCGPTQCGKTTGRVIPAILGWSGPQIVLSVKGDVLERTISEREQRGDVKMFDPTGITGRPAATWNPVAAAASTRAAKAMSAGMLQIGTATGDKDPIWREAANELLPALLLAAHERQGTMRTVRAWVTKLASDVVREEIADALERSRDPYARDMLDVVKAVRDLPDQTRGSVTWTLSTLLGAFGDPGVIETTATTSITPDWLLAGENTLYLIAPAADQRRLRAVYTALVMHVLDSAFARAQASPGGRLAAPLLACLDELCNCAPLGRLDELASTGAGQGVVLLSVVQDIGQLQAAFGREKAGTIVTNHRGRLLYPGVADEATLQYIHKVLGDRVRDKESRTSGRRGGTTTTRAQERWPLVAPHELRTRKRGEALLIYGSLAPAWLEQRMPS